MTLFIDGRCGHRIFVTSAAQTRGEMPNWFELRCPLHQSVAVYSNRSVFALAESGQIAAGAVLGGLIGLLAGPLGLMLGGAAGAALGATNENTEAARAQRFNQS